MRHGRRARELRLCVDPISCAGHGLCADLLPQHVVLDEWGYPVLDRSRTSGPLRGEALPLARTAVATCPTLALRLEHVPTEDE
ncbi:ferredoxin [Pseudonocardia sp. T1-2H]|uniref:ferredoxin n=1 Tax=Pseudonocardia sp. T1-2H TaxID=3128899 RepID=UPI0031018765